VKIDLYAAIESYFGIIPDYNTISNFRRDNPTAIKKVFRATVNLAKNYDLIGGILLVGEYI
jgi:transposase